MAYNDYFEQDRNTQQQSAQRPPGQPGQQTGQSGTAAQHQPQTHASHPGGPNQHPQEQQNQHQMQDGHHQVKVKKSGSLSDIAQDITGNANRWQELAKCNSGRNFTQSTQLQAGETLNVPSAWAK